MMRHMTILALAMAVLCVACHRGTGDGDNGGNDAVGSMHFNACIGQHGECSTDCCVNEESLSLQRVRSSCTFRNDTLNFEEIYTVNISIPVRSRVDDEGMQIRGEIQFLQESTTPVPVNCNSFIISIGDDTFEAGSCGDVDPYPGGGGGCEVQAYLDEDMSLIGQLVCKELPGYSGDTYMSTVDTDAVGWGTFTIEGCVEE